MFGTKDHSQKKEKEAETGIGSVEVIFPSSAWVFL